MGFIYAFLYFLQNYNFSLLPQGINTITIEIFDERSFTMDELIAWTQIVVPQQVLTGETHEDWYPLNGKQGEGVEGMINLVLSYSVGVKPQFRWLRLKFLLI